MTALALSTPAERLARIMQGLHERVAAEGLARGLAGPFVLLICARLRRLVTSFAAYADSAPPRPRKPEPPRLRRTSAPPPLPRRFAWLLRCVPGTAAAASQLRHLLAEPDMRALIETRPATGRALRPLCHLLGIKPPPVLRLPLRPRAPKPAPEPAPQPPTPDAPSAGAKPPQNPAWPKPPPRYATVFFPRRRPRAAFAP